MGLTDRLSKLIRQGKESAAEHKQEVDSALQKAALAADRQTGGKYHDQIVKAETRAEDYVQNLEPPTAGDQDVADAQHPGGEHPPR